MKTPTSPEQQRIATLEHALEVSLQMLLRSHDAAKLLLIADELAERACVAAFLSNHGLTPASKAAKALLKRPMEAYHFELEKAVKRAVSK